MCVTEKGLYFTNDVGNVWCSSVSDERYTGESLFMIIFYHKIDYNEVLVLV